ncbi:hypothetical protein NMY22_g8217 [Coprinellus aureogranulatus]|nr:hypothetical protein NMY22_g8217 [Coprinellus aureogranulatus]
MNDIDANPKEEFKSLIGLLLEAIDTPIKRALAQAKLTLDQIHSAELVGGSTRVPAVKQKIQDEAIARSATFGLRYGLPRLPCP